MPMSVLATEMTDNRWCVVMALDICQWPLVAVAMAEQVSAAAAAHLYHVGRSSAMWPPRDSVPNDRGRLGLIMPSLPIHSLSKSASLFQAWWQDMNSLVISITRLSAAVRVRGRLCWITGSLGGGGLGGFLPDSCLRCSLGDTLIVFLSSRGEIGLKPAISALVWIFWPTFSALSLTLAKKSEKRK